VPRRDPARPASHWPRLAFFAWLLLAPLATLAAPLTLIYSGNLNGELEPCGCTAETDYGGIQRRATWLDGLRAGGSEPVVITTGGLLTADIGADRIKARFILDGFVALDYDVVGLQWTDLVYGTDFLAAVALDYTISNWRDDTFAASQAIVRGNDRLRYFQWLDPASSPFRGMSGDHDPVTEETAELAAALAAARQRGEVTLLGTTLTLERAQEQLPLADVAVLLVAATKETPGEPRQVGDMLVLTPSTRGMRLGRAGIETLDGGRVRLVIHEVVELTDTVANAERLTAWYDAYNDELRADYQLQVAARKARDSGASPYAGANRCRTCHTGAAATWDSTKHAGTLGVLETVGKAFDPNCVTCHVVAFDRPGGYLSFDATPHLANVQCEACHGPGQAHVVANGQGPYPGAARPVDVCVSCHHPKHSPGFVFADYWPRIAHGKEGVPPIPPVK